MELWIIWVFIDYSGMTLEIKSGVFGLIAIFVDWYQIEWFH
jgi:hypothetical protein